MKYCPYCGANLPEETVSFCSECGNALPDKMKNDTQQDRRKDGPVKRKRKPEKQSRQAMKPEQEVTEEKMPEADDGYDGYYDDIVPMDAGRQKEGIDKSIVKKIAILIAGLVVIIGICVALMYLL